MSLVENPNRHLSYLQQCLSSDKKPLGLFLGAGCPMAIPKADGTSPLIPDIAGLTKIVREELAKSKECRPFLEAIERQFQEDGRPNATVEDMLTQVRAFRAVAGNAGVRGLFRDSRREQAGLSCSLYILCHGTPLPTHA